VLGVKNYLTEVPHTPLAGICLPSFPLSSCHRQNLFDPLTSRLVRPHPTSVSVPCLKTLRTTSRTLSASQIIASSTKEGITHILHSIDNRESSRAKPTMWKSRYACVDNLSTFLLRDRSQEAPIFPTDDSAEAGPSTQQGPSATVLP